GLKPPRIAKKIKWFVSFIYFIYYYFYQMFKMKIILICELEIFYFIFGECEKFYLRKRNKSEKIKKKKKIKMLEKKKKKKIKMLEKKKKKKTKMKKRLNEKKRLKRKKKNIKMKKKKWGDYPKTYKSAHVRNVQMENDKLEGTVKCTYYFMTHSRRCFFASPKYIIENLGSSSTSNSHAFDGKPCFKQNEKWSVQSMTASVTSAVIQFRRRAIVQRRRIKRSRFVAFVRKRSCHILEVEAPRTKKNHRYIKLTDVK
ncbi:hypothetical protein RFI_22301, partial [Reticulomyxa filosa]